MNDTLTQVSRIGIIPVIAIGRADRAVPLARALSRGGLPAAEVTFRTAAGEEAIRRIAAECPDVLVGAGTILNVEQCDRALAAGARFIVSPGYNQELVDHCREKHVPVLPGCVNASDLIRASNSGLKTVKFFPAEASGGLTALKALAPVFPGLTFMPTGGVNTENLTAYLDYDRIIACGGTWMVKQNLIEGERWEEITGICREAVRNMLGLHLCGLGIDGTDGAEAEQTAGVFASLFGLDVRTECGGCPSLTVGTRDVDRAVYHLSRQGIRFEESTRSTDGLGRTDRIELTSRLGGFAVRLVRD